MFRVRGFLVAGLASALASACMANRAVRPPVASVFVIGGIHQAHEQAKKYTYERMGELGDHLRPDVLLVEAEQKFLDDGSDSGMPRDFATFMVPSARRRGVPIVGIDWWDEEKGRRWEELQQQAFSDPELAVDAALIGGMFQLLDAYFVESDFEEINAAEITALWEAKSELKYAVYRRHPAYRFLAAFERERNDHMADNILAALAHHPDKRALVAVGIDHKYYLERELRRRGVRVLTVAEVMAEWWR
ncbi:MAG: hypothetical protein HYX75_23620 [Acidobacteria bacterium]|nr:hypothetical protein [Acidobacteriota bacterium]